MSIDELFELTDDLHLERIQNSADDSGALTSSCGLCPGFLEGKLQGEATRARRWSMLAQLYAHRAQDMQGVKDYVPGAGN